MMPINDQLFSDLKLRNIIYQVTDEGLEAHLKQPRTLYCGFDPSSDSLHIGSLFPLMALKRFQLAGHRPIFLAGGATGMIGDPSGKSAERNLLSEEQVRHNLVGIQKIAQKVLDFAPQNGEPAAKIVDNADFYKDMSFLKFLREVGKHFTVNHMIAKDSVKSRMEDRDHGISYTEFSYMLLQAYDFYHLNQIEDCSLQIGASDQWGNITAGTEFIRKKAQKQAFGMTHPLITRTDGGKFGKSEKGTVWLSAEKTSPYQLYQFFIQSPDDSVIRWIQYLTLLTVPEIEALRVSLAQQPEKKEAQTALAKDITVRIHGTDALDRVLKATKALFGAEIRELDAATLADVFSETPTLVRPLSALEGTGLPLIDALSESGLFQSKGAARKEIPAGGVYVNNERITDAAFVLKKEQLIAGSSIVLRKGKKNYQLIRFS